MLELEVVRKFPYSTRHQHQTKIICSVNGEVIAKFKNYGGSNSKDMETKSVTIMKPYNTVIHFKAISTALLNLELHSIGGCTINVGNIIGDLEVLFCGSYPKFGL